MMVTIPFVAYGIYRYLYLLYVKGEGEAPEIVLLQRSSNADQRISCGWRWRPRYCWYTRSGPRMAVEASLGDYSDV